MKNISQCWLVTKSQIKMQGEVFGNLPLILLIVKLMYYYVDFGLIKLICYILIRD